MKKSAWVAVRVFSLLLGLALLFSLTGCVQEKEKLSELKVYFLDVGQGDAAVLVCDGHVMMIDGGESKQSQFIYTWLTQDMGISHIDVMVASHGDKDHIGGLSAALHACTVGRLLCSEREREGKTFKNLKKAAEEQGLEIEIPKAGESFPLGSATVTILSVGEGEEENACIVLRVDHGENSFLFMGDCEYAQEERIQLSGASLGADVLKVAHHGSNGSSSLGFLRQVGAKYAVISVGENSYGHPTSEVLEKLDFLSVTVLRTDERGNIVFTSDGCALSYECEKN